MKLSDSDAPAVARIPLHAWANLLSLDAVFVAVAWQQLLMRVFCNRSPRWPEAAALSLTVWLIYVADRLLDGVKLNIDQPHTLRHRFYRRQRRIFASLWIFGLLINTLVVVRWLPTDLMRNGLILAAAVLMYGVSVHFSSKRARRKKNVTQDAAGEFQQLITSVPKEVRVGVLFSLGVSLTTWTHLFSDLQYATGAATVSNTAVWPLLATTCVLALLFSWNCILVARFEREFDRAQAFPSIATLPGWFNGATTHYGGPAGLTVALGSLALLVALLVPLPLPIEIAGLASAVGLMASLGLPAGCSQRISKAALARGTPAMYDVRGAWVDAVLWTPPLVLLCWM